MEDILDNHCEVMSKKNNSPFLNGIQNESIDFTLFMLKEKNCKNS